MNLVKPFYSGISIFWSVGITVSYVAIKIAIAFGGLPIIERYINNISLQIETGEFLSTIITLVILILLFRQNIFQLEENRIPFPKIKIIAPIIICIIGLEIVEDPFFRYKNILLGETFLDTSSIEKINMSLVLVLKTIRVIILQSIFEELFFRKVIFTGLLKKYSNLWIAVFTSSFLFSITHLSIVNTVPTFIFGILAAYIFYKTQNIFYPILFHITMNLLWLLRLINLENYWSLLEYLNFGIMYWLIVLLGFGMMYFSMVRFKNSTR